MRDNVLVARFCYGRRTRTNPVTRIDYGWMLKFEGTDLPPWPIQFQVDFSNDPTNAGTSKPQLGTVDGVEVPQEYLIPGKSVYAYVYYVNEEYGYGRTEYVVEIPVEARPSRTDEQPTPTQQTVIDETIAALNTAVGQAQEAAALLENPGVAVETRPAGSSATGSYSGGTFSFGIPKGEQGRDAELRADRVTSLTETPLSGGAIVEAVGVPIYVSDVSQYAAYGITEAGWYTVARIAAPAGLTVSAATTITGAAGYIAAIGGAHVDVAVRFGVTAMSQAVTVSWDGQRTETFVFRATDLAVRNLDYRTTFYIYDIAPFATWSYALTSDATFAADKNYYTLSNGVYSLASVTASEAVPAYYTLADETYTQATGVFEDGVTYYTKSGDVYSEATVTVGEAIPAYYNHSKLHFEGMTRNVTYKLDAIVDCPIEIALPEVVDDGYGAWFEIQLRYSGSFSCTLLPPEGVQIGTVSTQSQTAGINVIDLQYTGVGGVAMWSLLNTHSNIPT